MCSTSPNTTVLSLNDRSPTKQHSRAIGDSATRAGATISDGSAVSSAARNSSTSDGNRVAVRLIPSTIGRVLMFTTNSPVSRTLRSESFSPTEVNCTTGGEAEATVKYECGARLSTPRLDRVETQAIGRGTTIELSIVSIERSRERGSKSTRGMPGSLPGQRVCRTARRVELVTYSR